MSLMPLHFTLCKDVTHGHVYVYWWRDVSTSECILRIQLRTVYEQTLLPNATTTNIDSDPTHPTHPTHHTSHPPRVYRNVHHIHIAYCIREHYIPFLLYSWNTTLIDFYLLLFIIYSKTWHLNVMGYRSHVIGGRSVVVSSRLVSCIWCTVPHPSKLVPHPSQLVPRLSKLVTHPSKLDIQKRSKKKAE